MDRKYNLFQNQQRGKGVWVTSYRGPVVKLQWSEKRSPKMPKTGHKAKAQTKILDLSPNICDHRKNK